MKTNQTRVIHPKTQAVIDEFFSSFDAEEVNADFISKLITAIDANLNSDKEKIEAEMFKIIKSNKDFMETPYLYGLKALTETTKILNGYVNDLTNFIDNPKLLYEAKNVLNEYTEFFPKYIEEIKIWNIELKNSFEKMKNKIEGFLKASNKIFPEYHEFRDWYITHCYFNLFLNKKEFFKRGILPNDFQLFHEAYSKMIEGRSFGEAITGLEVVIINNMVEFKQMKTNQTRVIHPKTQAVIDEFFSSFDAEEVNADLLERLLLPFINDPDTDKKDITAVVFLLKCKL